MNFIVEIAIFVSIAVIVGGLFIGFIVDLDVKNTFNAFNGLFNNDKSKDLNFKKVDSYGFVVELYNTWKGCGFGEISLNRTIYVEKKEFETEDSLNKEFIFRELKKLNYCKSLQSKEFNCGQNEDLKMDEINLPNVVTILCNSNGLEVVS